MLYKDIYEKVLNHIKKGESIFITGPAGSGKTFLLKEVYDHLKKNNKRVVLTSTTGTNAMNLGGMTIHKLMGIGTQSNKNYINYMKHTFLFSGIKKRLAKIDIIIIDEVSMLRADTFELINVVLQEVSANKLPFGGKTLIFTGDFYQIPPVVKSFEKEQNQWLFNSESWKNAKLNVIKMDDIYRQKDKKFVSFLNSVRKGEWNKEDEKIIEEAKKRKLPKGTTIFFSTNAECDEWNKKCLEEIDEKEYLYTAAVTGKRKKQNKENIIRNCIAKVELRLKKGVRIISISNDKDGKYMNGSEGVVTNLNEKEVFVKFNHLKKEVKIKPFTWMMMNINNRPIATFKQIPLLPAYALTIHKSQGMTLDSAIVDCKNIFACGQMYVALSRVRELKNLKVINFSMNQIKVNAEVSKFYKKLK